MRKIADRIEYSPTAIYFHFKDKQTLLQELCDTDFGALAHEFQKIARIGDPVDRLRRIGRAYVEFAIEYPNHYRLMFMTPSKASLEPEGSRLARGNPEEDAYAFLRATVADAIGSGQLRPELTDADLVSQMVWAGTHGVVSLQISNCNDAWIEWRDARETAHTLIEVMLRGLVRKER
jgi:AcrR family transcriptional regulator